MNTWGNDSQQSPWTRQTELVPVAQTDVDTRAAFLVKTYLHLFGAIGAFVALIALWFVTPVAGIMIDAIGRFGRGGIALLMLGFVGISWLASSWANSAPSRAAQYAGLALYVFAESVIFVPLIALALAVTGETGAPILPTAAGVTIVLFGGLTGIVLLTRRDFSFLRGILLFGGLAGLAIALGSLFFGFSLGLVFFWAMAALAGGYILYDTSNVLHHYSTDRYVAAALALFASFALLLWYVIRILISNRR